MRETITRRQFLAGAGLTLAIASTPVGIRSFARGEAVTSSEIFRPSAWFTITPDNRITVFVCKSEMGQGIHTALPILVAEELEADWGQVQIRQAPVTDEYVDPVQGSQMTYGSTSIRHLYEPLRKAAAAGREMLVQAAAQEWNVPSPECEASHSQVHHRSSGRTLSYGELCVAASDLPIPEKPRLKTKSEFKIMGTSVPRLDIPAKVSGQAQFGIDTFAPQMLYGAVARPPAYGAQLRSYDQQAAYAIPGVRWVGEIDRGIGVCADTPDVSWKAREALQVQWYNKGVQSDLSTETVERLLIQSLDMPGASARHDGDVPRALAQAHKLVQVEYLLPYLSHAPMEPMNCAAHVRADGCDVWVGTQGQTQALKKTAQITGLDSEQIQIHTTYLGGGFGRRVKTDFLEEAVELSKASGKPVKVIWKREEDIQYDAYRPGNSHRITGALNEQGRLIAWSHKVAAPSIIATLAPPAPPVDGPAVTGITGLQYEIPNVSVEYVRVKTPIPVHFWRSVGDSHNGFSVESFMDEMAHAAGTDPLEFRLQHLQHNPRAHRTLEVVAEKAGWGKPLPADRAQGIASYPSHGSYISQIAEVSVNDKTGKIRVHRVICAVDCGPIINRDNLVAQVEGALTMGLSAALKEKVEFSGGGVQSANFDDYQLLRMSEAPDVEVHILESDGPIGGMGETGLPPAAPVVANAVFAATGTRIRRLPMTPATFLEAQGRGD